MADFQTRFVEFKQRIDVITQEILEKLVKNNLSGVGDLFNQRFDLLHEMIALVSTPSDKNILVRYLNEFQKRDLDIAHVASKEYTQVKTILSNLHNLKDYISV